MVFLVQSQWLFHEARSLGVTASPEAIHSELLNEMGDSRQSRVTFTKLVESSGLTQQDLVLGAKINVLTKGVHSALERAARVTEGDLVAAYKQYGAQLGHPPAREIMLIEAKTRRNADLARSAIDGGASWAATAKRYSLSTSDRIQVPQPTGVAARERFMKAIFAAPPDHVEGPIPAPFGYLVFSVVRLRPAFRPTFQQARLTLVKMVRSQKQDAAAAQGVAAYKERYRRQTVCAAGFVILDLCGNATRKRHRS